MLRPPVPPPGPAVRAARSLPRSVLGNLGVATTTLLLAVLATACSNPFDSDAGDDAPQLEQAWTSTVTGWDSYRTTWAADDDVWVTTSTEPRGLVGVSLEDGDVRWSHPMVGEVCGLSEINDAGLVAMQSGSSCATLSVLDTATGGEVWTDQVRFGADTYPGDSGQSIALTEQTLAVATDCGVERWSVADGTFAGRLTTPRAGARRNDGYCRPSAASAQAAFVAGPRGLAGYDVDSGERRWHLRGAGAALHHVYPAPRDGEQDGASGDGPLVVDVALDGVRGLRTVDPSTGELGPVLGRPLSEFGRSPAHADVVGSTVLGSYEDPAGGFAPTYGSVLRGWEVESGEESLAREVVGDEHLGADRDAVYLGREVERDGGGSGYWVMRFEDDGAGVSDPRTVGWTDEFVLDAVRVGDLLITSGGSVGVGEDRAPTTAYRLPDTAEDLEIPPSDGGYVETQWADDDLRPDPLVDPCALVSSATVRTAGFSDDTAALDAPLDCRWVEGDRVLQVSVTVARPDDAGQTAQQVAEQQYTRVVASLAGGGPALGLGEQAWQRGTATVGVTPWGLDMPGRSSSDASLVVREANVVVSVGYLEEPGVDIGRQDALPTPASEVQAALRAAADEALAAWEETTDGSGDGSAPDDGPVTDLPDPCRTLAAPVRALFPRQAPHDLTEPGARRLRGCHWSTRERYGPFVQVTAYATGPNPLAGVSATSEAGAIVAADGIHDEFEADARRVRGPWDEGWVVERTAPGYGTWRLLVRAENVVLAVQVASTDEPTRRDQVVDLARDYLAAVGGGR